MVLVQNISIWILIKVTGLDENAEKEFRGGKISITKCLILTVELLDSSICKGQTEEGRNQERS